MRSNIDNWIEKARARLNDGGIGAAELDELAAINARRRQRRQSLLYLTANGMTTISLVIAAEHRAATRTATAPRLESEPQMPYLTVHDAIVDGWRVIQFPSPTAPISDRELDIVGYQFVLEKMEEFDD